MKESVFVFNKTVKGYRHSLNGIPCQDYSMSLCSGDTDFCIVAVGDGHGDPACHRSDKGSTFAVEVAVDCLSKFADALLSGGMSFDYPRQQRDCLRQLTGAIISKWIDRVNSDLVANPVSDAELESTGSHKELYRKGERLVHLYGTTLIAALLVSNYLVLLQQGDGRCDVLFSDGTISQPIPWDPLCKGTTTTSMCNSDAAQRIRFCVIDLTQDDVAACYLGSDGVEDSYYDNEVTQEGTHRFFMELSCKAVELGNESFITYLEEMLPSFSKSGSGDDVSVAGIVAIDQVKDLVDVYRRKVDEYDYVATRQKTLVELEGKKVSMSRKHELLKKKVDQAGMSIEEYEKAKIAFDEYDEEYQRIESEIIKLREQIDLFNKGQLSDEADNRSLSCVDSENLGEQVENEEKQVSTEAEEGQVTEEKADEYHEPVLMEDVAVGDLTVKGPEEVRSNNDVDEDC